MALRLESVSYRYPAVAQAATGSGGAVASASLTPAFKLRCDHFEVEPGTSVCVTGDNGSGKSTLSKLLCGILKPDTGAVSIDDGGGGSSEGDSAGAGNSAGRDLTGAPLAIFGRAVGYVFQEPAHQLFATTVIEELVFVGRLMGTDRAALDARAEDLLARFGLRDLRARSPLRLSRGEQQRLAIAAVLMQRPRYLVLDEPTSGLDTASADQLLAVRTELCAGGVGLCVISHDPRLRAYAQRAVRVEAGVVRP